jgi:hypothetical protein
MLALSRIETEDFLRQHQVPLSPMSEADLDREAKIFEASSRRDLRLRIRGMIAVSNTTPLRY